MENANVYQDSPALVVKNFVRKDIGDWIVTSHANVIVQILFVIPHEDASAVPATGVSQVLTMPKSNQYETIILLALVQQTLFMVMILGDECATRPGQRIGQPGSTKSPSRGMEISETDLGTVVGVPVVLLLSCIILAIMFYCRCYIPAQRKKTLERAISVTYNADPASRPGK